MNSETFLQNKKRKEKYSNSKNSETLLKICNTIFLSCFFCIRFLLKKTLCYLFESVSEVESCGTYRLNLPLEITVNGSLKPPKNITRLNTNLGFSVSCSILKILFLQNYFKLTTSPKQVIFTNYQKFTSPRK